MIFRFTFTTLAFTKQNQLLLTQYHVFINIKVDHIQFELGHHKTLPQWKGMKHGPYISSLPKSTCYIFTMIFENQRMGYKCYNENNVLKHTNQLLDQSKPKIMYLIVDELKICS